MRVLVNIRNLSLFFIIVFSGFYLTRILSLSPIYVSYLIGTIVMISYSFFTNTSFYTNKLSIIYVIYIIYLVITQIYLEANSTSLINVLFSLIYFVTTINIAFYSTNRILIQYSKYFIWFTILLLTIEALWRITHPVFFLEGALKDYRDMEGMLFYAYKFSSIMFMDSNFVGTYALTAFFYYYYLLRKNYTKSKVPLILLFFLIVGTLSRSAIITVFVTFLFIYFLSIKIKIKHILLFFSIVILVSFFLIPKIMNDPSFSTKFIILNSTWEYIQKSSLLNFLFGIGFGNSYKYMELGGHNLFITHFVESGLIGLLFFLMINLSLIKRTQKYSLYLTIPLFISGMSLAGHAISYYYACLALIFVIQQNERKNICTNSHL